MSKFCAFCGKEIDDEATVCPECNAQVVEPEQTEPEQEVVEETAELETVQEETVEQEAAQEETVEQEVVQEAPAEEKKTVTITIPSKDDVVQTCNKWFSIIKNNKVYSGVAIGVLALIVIVILCCLIFSGGYKTAVKNYFDVSFNGKAQKIEKLAPEAFWDEEDVDLDEIVEEYEDEYKDFVDEFEDEYGNDIKFSYKITDAEKMDKDDLKDIADNIHDRYDYIDDDDVKSAYEVEIEITVEGDDDDDEQDIDMIAVKIDGDWYLVSEYGSFAASTFLYY